MNEETTASAQNPDTSIPSRNVLDLNLNLKTINYSCKTGVLKPAILSIYNIHINYFYDTKMQNNAFSLMCKRYMQVNSWGPCHIKRTEVTAVLC